MFEKDIIISIIIPCYNHGIYIDEAIKSVEEYKFDNYEIIIINDGSTDDYTNKRLIELKSEGYNVIFQENKGLGRTRNNGIRLAKGKYILPLDADNKIKPDYILKAINILDSEPSISIVYSDRKLFGNSDESFIVGEFSIEKIVNCNYIDACAIFRKSLWEQVGGYDDKMPVQGWEDWDFWLMAIENESKFYYIPEPLFYYRVLDHSMIQQLMNSPNYNLLLRYVYIKHAFIMKEKFIDEMFKLQNEINYLNQEIVRLNQTKAYRLGKFILKPFLNIRKQFVKI